MREAVPFLLMLSAACSESGEQDAFAQSKQGLTGRVCDCHSTCRGAELVYYCGAEEDDVWSNPCLNEEFSNLPFCDTSLDIKSRVSDILSRIPDDEKLGSAGNRF